jgi:WD40 repeat protein
MINVVPFIALQLILTYQSCPKLYSQDNDNTNDSVVLLNKKVKNNPNELHRVKFLQFLNNSPYIIGALQGIKLWKRSDGSVEDLISVTPDYYVRSFVVSHDESKVIACIENYDKNEFSIVCYSLINRSQLWKIDNTHFRNFLGVSNDDKIIYVVGSYYVTRINATTGQIIGKQRMFLKYYWLPTDGGLQVKFSHSGEYALFWKDPFGKFDFHIVGQRIRVWNMITNKIEASKFIAGRDVAAACFLNDENKIMTGNFDGSLRLWLTKNNEIDSIWKINTLKFKNKTRSLVIDFLIVPNLSSKYIAIIGKYNNEWALKIYSYPQMKLTSIFLKPAFDGHTWSVATFNDVGDQFVICDKNNLYLYNTSNWQIIWQINI